MALSPSLPLTFCALATPKYLIHDVLSDSALCEESPKIARPKLKVLGQIGKVDVIMTWAILCAVQAYPA